MNITLEEINNVIVELYKNPVQSVSLSDGRSYTYRDLDSLLKLRGILMDELNKENLELTSQTFVKTCFDHT